MHRQSYVILVALAALTSGCWRYACIDNGGATCTDQFDSIFCSRGSGDGEYDSSYDDEDACGEGPHCEETRSFTSCSKEGFPYECDGVWYRVPCE